MDAIEIAFIVVVLLWAIWVGFILRLNILGYKIFRLLSKKFPDYYASIGRPRALTFNFIRGVRAQTYLQTLLFKGIPKDAPRDDEIKDLMLRAKWSALQLYILLGIFFVMVIIFALFAALNSF